MDDVTLAQSIEHTLLRADASTPEIQTLCQDAIRCRFLGVCVNPARIALARTSLASSPVRLVTVVGFPLGASLIPTKVDEAKRALDQGADELDLVPDLGAIRDRDWSRLARDIRAVALSAGGAPLKVILESALWDDLTLQLAAQVAIDSGANFLKTSTGFGPGGATVSAVRTLAAAAGAGPCRVKASGGIRERAFACELIAAGAHRLGTSASCSLVSA